jgi:transposase
MVGSGRERMFDLAGLRVEKVFILGDRVQVHARSAAPDGRCPQCGRPSRRVHSRYHRRVADLPAQGRAVEVNIAVRRFRCPHDDCPRWIFAERLDPRAAASRARRTGRLDGVVHHLGMALGGRPAQTLARRLMLP